MKRRLVLVLVLLIVVQLACDIGGNGNGNSGGNSGSGNQPSGPSDGNGNGGNSQPTQPAGTPDLQISNAFFEKSSTAAFGYIVKITVRNTGSADATFDATCDWRCPGGTITSSGMGFSGMYIGAGQTRDYTPSITAQVCNPLAAIVENFVCTVDPDNDVQETNENNNTWSSGQLAVPF